jgi:hypothetical protein
MAAAKKKVVKKRPAVKKANRAVKKAAVESSGVLPRGSISVNGLGEMLPAALVRHARSYPTRSALEVLCNRLEEVQARLDKQHASEETPGKRTGLAEGITPTTSLDDLPTDELVLYARRLPSKNACEALCVRLEVMEGKLDKLHALGVIDGSNNLIPPKPAEPSGADLAASVEGDTYQEITENFIAAMDRVKAYVPERHARRGGVVPARARPTTSAALQMSIDAITDDIGDSGDTPRIDGEEEADEKDDEGADVVEG